MVKNPEAGQIETGSGGVRKLHWGMKGRGKRGGIRVIYYFKRRDNEIWLLTLFSKNDTENTPAHILKQIAEEITNV
jgi:hypothetical protein